MAKQNFGGRERRVVSFREILNRSLVQLLEEDYSCGEKFTDDDIREAL